MSFKYFFNSALEGIGGNQVGSESVKAKIKTLIEQENNNAPLTDENLSDHINKLLGVKVARRTIAKYRESMGIPTATKRKKIF